MALVESETAMSKREYVGQVDRPSIASHTTTSNLTNELESMCVRAISNLIRENDALFIKNEPTSISLQIRRGTDNELTVGASATVRIRVYASSDTNNGQPISEYPEDQ